MVAKRHSFNPFTGNPKKRARVSLPRKRRYEQSSTVAERSASTFAKEQIDQYVASFGQRLYLSLLLLSFVKLRPRLDDGRKKFVCAASACMLGQACLDFMIAGIYIELDSDLMDLDPVVLETKSYRWPLRRPRIADFRSPDEAEQFTRFGIEELYKLLDLFELDEYIRVPQNPNNADNPKKYKFHREELLIVTLHKMNTRKTWKDIADDRRFGGSECRWSKGYRWLVLYLDERYEHLIGPQALAMWVPYFEVFAEKISAYLNRMREEYGHIEFQRDDFNSTVMFGDCTIIECGRVGSGPTSPEDGTRREDAYLQQRAIYDGHHKTHALKVLTFTLPNGLTSAVFGPCSARRSDPTLLQWSGIDEYLFNLQREYFPDGRIYTAYLDAVFGGYHLCFRTRHEPLPALGLLLTLIQELENKVYKKARVSIENNYCENNQYFPLLKVKEFTRLHVDSELIMAQTRIMLFLTNVIRCSREGSNCSGDRMFDCPPPPLDLYLNGMK